MEQTIIQLLAITFNRTKLELKYSISAETATGGAAFNRTKLELKFILDLFTGMLAALLIAPNWN